MSQDSARVIPAHIAAYLKQPAAVLIEPGIQNYDWGNPEFIPEHFGYDNTARRPYAEVWMGAHPELIDPFNDYKVSGYNPMRIPFADNGFAVITKENADSFDLNAYMEGRDTN